MAAEDVERMVLMCTVVAGTAGVGALMVCFLRVRNFFGWACPRRPPSTTTLFAPPGSGIELGSLFETQRQQLQDSFQQKLDQVMVKLPAEFGKLPQKFLNLGRAFSKITETFTRLDTFQIGCTGFLHGCQA